MPEKYLIDDFNNDSNISSLYSVLSKHLIWINPLDLYNSIQVFNIDDHFLNLQTFPILGFQDTILFWFSSYLLHFLSWILLFFLTSKYHFYP